jgi:hypothetical protein
MDSRNHGFARRGFAHRAFAHHGFPHHGFNLEKRRRAEPRGGLGAATVQPGPLAHWLLRLGRREMYALRAVMRFEPIKPDGDLARKRWAFLTISSNA